MNWDPGDTLTEGVGELPLLPESESEAVDKDDDVLEVFEEGDENLEDDGDTMGLPWRLLPRGASCVLPVGWRAWVFSLGCCWDLVAGAVSDWDGMGCILLP